jgi:hypothetical protein
VCNTLMNVCMGHQDAGRWAAFPWVQQLSRASCFGVSLVISDSTPLSPN